MPIIQIIFVGCQNNLNIITHVKATNTILIVSLFCLICKPLQAQSSANDGPMTSVALSIKMDTNVAVIGFSVLNLVMQVSNSSSNSIYVLDASTTPDGTTSLYLTNDTGHSYELRWLIRSDFDQIISHKAEHYVGAESDYQWPLSFKISKQIDGKDVMPGTYKLRAVHGILTVAGKKQKLVSNELELRLINYEDSHAWGKPINGTQLSINLDANTIVIDQTNRIVARVRNSATNTCFVMDVAEMSFTLTDSSGHVYQLPSLHRSDWDGWIFERTGDVLENGDIKAWPLGLRVGKRVGDKEIFPGTYILQATRDVSTSGHQIFKLFSNPVEVQLKEPEKTP